MARGRPRRPRHRSRCADRRPGVGRSRAAPTTTSTAVPASRRRSNGSLAIPTPVPTSIEFVDRQLAGRRRRSTQAVARPPRRRGPLPTAVEPRTGRGGGAAGGRAGRRGAGGRRATARRRTPAARRSPRPPPRPSRAGKPRTPRCGPRRVSASPSRNVISPSRRGWSPRRDGRWGPRPTWPCCSPSRRAAVSTRRRPDGAARRPAVQPAGGHRGRAAGTVDVHRLRAWVDDAGGVLRHRHQRRRQRDRRRAEPPQPSATQSWSSTTRRHVARSGGSAPSGSACRSST